MKLKQKAGAAAIRGGQPAAGRWIASEPGDRSRWLQTSEYTPANAARILEAANEGDVAELAVAAEVAIKAGVKRENIWYDPGFGFAKTVEQNFELAREIDKLRPLGKLFIGVSRKSFIGAVGGEKEPAKRLPGTLAMELFFYGRAECLRTHDVAALCQALAVKRCLESE